MFRRGAGRVLPRVLLALVLLAVVPCAPDTDESPSLLDGYDVPGLAVAVSVGRATALLRVRCRLAGDGGPVTRADIDALNELVDRVDQKVDALDVKLDRRFDDLRGQLSEVLRQLGGR